MYDAPITSVFPGTCFIEKRSSEEITSFSTPGIFSGNIGLPPTAIRIFLAVTSSEFPFISVSFKLCYLI
jgi:hypothetical protein